MRQRVAGRKRKYRGDIVTPAGIRQAFPLHSKAPDHLKWSRVALRGLTYLVTDKGPQRHPASLQTRWGGTSAFAVVEAGN